jgi:hypothetical protein
MRVSEIGSITSYRENRLKSTRGGSINSEVTTATAIEHYLKGIHFPSNKVDLINHAHQHWASQDVLNVLDRFSEKEYTTVFDVLKEISRAEG